MAKIKQFTIAVENRPGTVAEIARILGSAKVNILSLRGTAQGASGTIELVAEDARRAKKALDEAKISYRRPQQRSTSCQTKPVLSRSAWRNSRPEGLISSRFMRRPRRAGVRRRRLHGRGRNESCTGRVGTKRT